MPADIEELKSLAKNLYELLKAKREAQDATTQNDLQAKILQIYDAWPADCIKYRLTVDVVYNTNSDKNVEDLVEIFANYINQAEERAAQEKKLNEQNELQPSIELFPPILFDFCLHPAIQILAVIFLLIGIAALLTSFMITMGVPITFISPCIAFPLATSGAVTTTLGGAILACGFFHPAADIDEEKDVNSQLLQRS